MLLDTVDNHDTQGLVWVKYIKPDLLPDLSLHSNFTLVQLCQIMSVQVTDILPNKLQKQ